MPTAEQLLASLSEVDRTFVIDNDLRTIRIPSTITNLGVQSDDEVLTVYFQMPATYCGVDLSKFHVRINYLNAASEGDYHDVDDAAIQPDGTIKFSWTIGRHAASVIGNVEFNVCLKQTDSTGKVLKEFNTTPATLPILKGLEVSDRVITEYNDILEQWRARLFGIGDTEEARLLAVSAQEQQVISTKSAKVLSDIELKGSETLATIPETYTEVYNMADEAIRTKADAIILEAEGSVISVNDSSDDHLQNLRVFGRTTQLKTTGANIYPTQSVEFTREYSVDLGKTYPAGTYTFSGVVKSSDTDVSVCTVLFNLDNTNVGSMFISRSSQTERIVYTKKISGEFNRIGFYAADGWSTSMNDVGTFTDIMINEGETALPYEPYTGGQPGPNPDHPLDLTSVENPTVNILGKNLVRTNHSKDVTYEGLHIVITKGLSEVILDGTTTKSYGYAMSEGTYLSPGRYTMSVYGLNNVSTKYDQAYLMNMATRTTVCAEIKTGSPVTFDVVEGGIHRIDFLFAEGTTYNNTVIRFQIEAGDRATEYEPYVEPRTLTLNRTLRGIPVSSGGNYTDENGQQWICDEVDFKRGVYIQKIGVLRVEGSSAWTTYTSAYGHYGFMIWHALNDTYSRSIGLCDQLYVGDKSDNCIWVGVNDDCLYVLTKEWYDKGLDAWKTHMNEKPLNIIYVLNTPIETPLTSDEILAFRKLKTNHPNTTVLNDNNVHMSIKYSADTLTFIRENQPKSSDIILQSPDGTRFRLTVGDDGTLSATPET